MDLLNFLMISMMELMFFFLSFFFFFFQNLVSKESACNVGDLGLIPGLGRSPGEQKDFSLQYSGLENFMDCIVHGVAKSRTPLSDFHFHFIKKHLGAGKRLVKRKPTGFLLRVG